MLEVINSTCNVLDNDANMVCSSVRNRWLLFLTNWENVAVQTFFSLKFITVSTSSRLDSYSFTLTAISLSPSLLASPSNTNVAVDFNNAGHCKALIL